MGRLCFVFNMAPRYVEASYLLFDKEFDIHWCFGSNDTDIEEMDHSLLKDVDVYPTVQHGKAYSLKGISKVARDRSITSYVLIGDPTCLSMWKLPYLIRIHNPKAGIYFWTHGWYGKESRIKVLLKKSFFKPSDGIFLYGNYARDLMTKAGFNPDKLHTIHNSLDYGTQLALRKTDLNDEVYQKHFGNSDPVLIFIGRLTAVKRLDLLLEAVGKLIANGYGYNVIFVGDGPEREMLISMAERLGLNDRVWFYGACYDEETNAKLIHNADLCVAPGNIGLTAMHSMVFGTPALTHDDFKWQMPEFEAIHDGTTGCFFERDNASSLAEAIYKWFLHNGSRRDIIRSECCKEIDSNWTPEYELDVLKKVLGQ